MPAAAAPSSSSSLAVARQEEVTCIGNNVPIDCTDDNDMHRIWEYNNHYIAGKMILAIFILQWLQDDSQVNDNRIYVDNIDHKNDGNQFYHWW